MFPIFSENGDAVAFGGRILPGSPILRSTRTRRDPDLRQVEDAVRPELGKGRHRRANQVIVCEGYTDVIGFHRAGVKRAVATCGTALTEEHVRMLKRFASRVVLAFDADDAGQGAAERFYEWEQKYQVQVSVAAFPKGKDPGELGLSDPDALAAAVDTRMPFLGFRLQRVMTAGRCIRRRSAPASPSRRWPWSTSIPNVNMRKLYAGQVAPHSVSRSTTWWRSPRPDASPASAGRAPTPARAARERGVRGHRPAVAALARRSRRGSTRRCSSTTSHRRAFLAVAEADGAWCRRSSSPTPRHAN